MILSTNTISGYEASGTMTLNTKRRVGAWVVMDIFEVRDMSVNLIRLLGPIIQSNFLTESEHTDMPVMAELAEHVTIGDRVKLVFTTTRGELEDFQHRKAAGFSDSGYRYFKWSDDGWELVYEG